jgi:hypothetical protein
MLSRHAPFIAHAREVAKPLAKTNGRLHVRFCRWSQPVAAGNIGLRFALRKPVWPSILRWAGGAGPAAASITERGLDRKYGYPSHGLRFKVIRATETLDDAGYASTPTTVTPRSHRPVSPTWSSSYSSSRPSLGKSLCWRLEVQRFPGPLVELARLYSIWAWTWKRTWSEWRPTKITWRARLWSSRHRPPQ